MQLKPDPLGSNELGRAKFRFLPCLAFAISCVGPPSEIQVHGELLFRDRYIQLCDSDDYYALVFPAEVASQLKQRLEQVDPEGDRILLAEFRGPLFPAPEETSAKGMLAVFYIMSVAPGGCP